MIEFERIFVDTAPFIYFLEKNPTYYEKPKNFFRQCYEKGIEIVTSAITVEEYAVFPYRNQKIELIDLFHEFVKDMEIDVVSIDQEIAEKAAKIRAKYKDFKSMDALQIASAIQTGCDVFLTNDKQLRQEKEIRCIVMDEL